MKPETIRLMEQIQAGNLGPGDHMTRAERITVTKLRNEGLVDESPDGREYVLLQAGRERLQAGATPPSKRKRVKAAMAGPTNGAVRLAPAAAPARTNDADYRELLVASLEREALLAGMYARELRRKA
jgi:hypothetical protein